MDEVDKIIFQSLRQLGCEIDSSIKSLDNFTCELFVRAVAMCLQEIRQDSPVLTKTLSQNMAQRFVTATALADACTACGYRSDIGYQTFLYPNKVEVRRLFMFLVEKMSKNKSAYAMDALDDSISPLDTNFQQMQREIKTIILQQLKEPWLPAYCRNVNYRDFRPNLNLSISTISMAGNFCQQTIDMQHEITSTVLHHNAMDQCNKIDINDISILTTITPTIKVTPTTSNDINNENKLKLYSNNNNNNSNSSTITSSSSKSSRAKKLSDVEILKESYDKKLKERQIINEELYNLNKEKCQLENRLESLNKTYKLKQRTNVILTEAAENLPKLVALIENIQGRREKLEAQWTNYRQPMIKELHDLELMAAKRKPNSKKNNILELQKNIKTHEIELRNKRLKYAQLLREVKAIKDNNDGREISHLTRQEYTRRLLEFSGNIRKQNNDINKVLQDTRDLQKQINNIESQLQRQFNYTDDLLYQNAKRCSYAKRAYKLLIALHASCTKLVELNTLTNNISKNVRELEVQIDREKDKNVALNYQQISYDLHNIENVIKNIQSEIYKEENKITAC